MYCKSIHSFPAQSQEEDFRLQNKTLMEELSKVGGVWCDDECLACADAHVHIIM